MVYSRMNPHMNDEVTLLYKCLTTGFTLIGISTDIAAVDDGKRCVQILFESPEVLFGDDKFYIGMVYFQYESAHGYCKGKAKEATEHCVIMDPEEGYVKAKEILLKNFGRTHIVAKAFLDKIIKGPPIKINDGEKLSQLSCDMETCILGSNQLGLESNLDSLDTLGKVVARLPIPLKARWAEKASKLYDQGTTPKFQHLAKFVEERSAVANTHFGQLIQDVRVEREVKVKPRAAVTPTVKTTTLATTSTPAMVKDTNVQRSKCYHCGADHYLDQCEQFKRMRKEELDHAE
ncbi:hypothetical protein QZH41_002288 [Actinostola sp. cb2023]|nr:hypothetical protein QZH41_002288 [Actinostola sp. cb2023]